MSGDLFMRQVLVYPGENSYWVAECPSLPGCVSQGKSKEEAVTNIKEAIDGYISSLVEDGLLRFLSAKATR
jgi:predicted RNase H-like HicB family nuclease